ncbi:MAG TPA: thioredoxin family protein [Planctomicrobium sp.]|nr:thioredoxin family protein [Planctomicrobium sp.]
MNSHPLTIPLMLYGLIFLSSCGVRDSPQVPYAANLPPVPVVDAHEFNELIENSPEPILVEFSVLAGCFRCNDMRPQLQQLASDYKDRIQVVRMDFHLNQKLVASLGATVCPSYVLISNRLPRWVQNDPTSGGLLSNRISDELSTDRAPDLKSPSNHQSGEDFSTF